LPLLVSVPAAFSRLRDAFACHDRSSGSAASVVFRPWISRVTTSICSWGGGIGLTPAAGRPIPQPSKEAPLEPRFAQRIDRTASQMNMQTNASTPAIHAKGASAFIVFPMSLTFRGHRGAIDHLQCRAQIFFLHERAGLLMRHQPHVNGASPEAGRCSHLQVSCVGEAKCVATEAAHVFGCAVKGATPEKRAEDTDCSRARCCLDGDY
jgi:hypothetical protein